MPGHGGPIRRADNAVLNSGLAGLSAETRREATLKNLERRGCQQFDVIGEIAIVAKRRTQPYTPAIRIRGVRGGFPRPSATVRSLPRCGFQRRSWRFGQRSLI